MADSEEVPEVALEEAPEEVHEDSVVQEEETEEVEEVDLLEVALVGKHVVDPEEDSVEEVAPEVDHLVEAQEVDLGVADADHAN